MSPLIIRRVPEEWAVVDGDVLVIRRFDTLHEAEQFVIAEQARREAER